MKLFELNYRNFYGGCDARDVLEMWNMMFAKDDTSVVVTAAKNYIETNSRPPTVADIRKQIDLIKHPETETDLWALIKKAASNGIYGAEEEFEKLPEECKSFIGSPASLRELAQCDVGTMDTVVKGQFLKRVESIQEHQAVQNGLPMEVRQALAKSSMRMLTEGEL